MVNKSQAITDKNDSIKSRLWCNKFISNNRIISSCLIVGIIIFAVLFLFIGISAPIFALDYNEAQTAIKFVDITPSADNPNPEAVPNTGSVTSSYDFLVLMFIVAVLIAFIALFIIAIVKRKKSLGKTGIIAFSLLFVMVVGAGCFGVSAYAVSSSAQGSHTGEIINISDKYISDTMEIRINKNATEIKYGEDQLSNHQTFTNIQTSDIVITSIQIDGDNSIGTWSAQIDGKADVFKGTAGDKIILEPTIVIKPGQSIPVIWTTNQTCQDLMDLTGTTPAIIKYNLSDEVCTATFETNGGQPVPESQTVLYGNLLTKPTDPIIFGYDFVGWFTDSEFQEQWDFDKDCIKENMTLYAKYIPKVVNSTFDAGDGEFVLSDKVLDSSENINNISDNESNINSSNAYLEESQQVINNSQANAKTVTIEQLFDSNYVLPAHNPVRNNYSFVNYFGNDGKIITKDTVVKNPEAHTIVAQWTVSQEYRTKIITELNTMLDDYINYIRSYVYLGDKQEQYIAEFNQAVEEAINQILSEEVTTVEQVNKIAETLNKQLLAKFKDVSKEEISGAETDINNKIKDIDGLTQDDLTRYAGILSQIKNDKQSEVDTKDNKEDVVFITNSAKQLMNNVLINAKELGSQKIEDVATIDKEAQTAITTITNTFNNLPKSRKEYYETAINSAATSGKDLVVQAQTTEEVKEISAKTQALINDLLTQAQQEEQDSYWIVNYDMNNHGEQIQPSFAKYGSLVTKPANPSAAGYTFGGWFTDVELKTEWDFLNDKAGDIPNDNCKMTLYAKWTINQYTLTVNYQYAGGAKAAESVVELFYYNEPYSFDSPTITGYTPDKPIVKGNMPASDETVTVTYNARTDIVATFDAAEGSFEEGAKTKQINQTFNALYTYPSNPTRTGYTFAGWKDQNEKILDPSTSLVDSVSPVLTAQWTINKYTIRFEVDSTGYGKVDAESYIATYGDSYDASTATLTIADDVRATASPNEPTEQYTFAFNKWTSTVGSLTTGIITSDITFTANFSRQINKYKVPLTGTSLSWQNLDGKTITEIEGDYGSEVTVKPVADSGYDIVSVKDNYENDYQISTYGTVTITIKKSLSVTALAGQFDFYAVFNTAAENDNVPNPKVANTLSFYYDGYKSKHASGETKTVYDNLPLEASSADNWGYDSQRSIINNVSIDSKVADFHELKSTAFMFANMTSVNDLTGCEYLDTANVTNMQGTFEMFAQQSSSISKVPDVSEWKTANVKDMSRLFCQYAELGNTGFNLVPDISMWETSEVTSMNSMFKSFAQASAALKTSTLDVTNLKTNKVVDMSAMFSGVPFKVVDIYGFTFTENTQIGATSTETSYSDLGMFANCPNLEIIYFGDNISEIVPANKSYWAFNNSQKLPRYSTVTDQYRDRTYASPDNGENGYFSSKTPTMTLAGDEHVLQFANENGDNIEKVQGNYGDKVKVKPVYDKNCVADKILDNAKGAYVLDSQGYFEIDMKFNGSINATSIGHCIEFENETPEANDMATVKFANHESNNPNLQYSFDKKTWQTWNAGTDVTLDSAHPKIYVKGNNTTGFSASETKYTNFVMTGKIKASGNVMSLIDNGTCYSTTKIPCDYCFISLFEDCTSLSSAPVLPVTTLTKYCYASMFKGCSNLINPPSLPAKSNAEYCYTSMFSGCTNLISAPELSATALAKGCYSFMFTGCSNIVLPPELPAEALADDCYSNMFSGCINLTSAPELNAETMTTKCYEKMFMDCKSLVTPPLLPGTTLAVDCYAGMFKNCINIAAPVGLPVSSLVAGCYQSMFSGCTNLIILPKLSATTLADNCYQSMFEDCAKLSISNTSGMKFMKFDTGATDSTKDMFKGVTCSFSGDPSDSIQYYYDSPVLTFENDVDAGSTSSTIKYVNHGTNTPNIQYSFDKSTWNAWNPDTEITLDSTHPKIFLIGNNAGGFNKSKSNYTNFVMNGKIKSTGSVMSLIDNGNNSCIQIPCPYCFTNLFSGCTGLTEPPQLTATLLHTACYDSMFYECEGLANAPLLPANILTLNCYENMFYGCKALTEPPVLPSTTLAEHCYAHMFSNCSSLSYSTVLPAKKLTRNCYQSMFDECVNLVNPPALSAETLENSCYQSMFAGCVNLCTPPALPATTLADNCYDSMFYNCSNLAAPPQLPATALPDNCYHSMFSGCKSLQISDSAGKPFMKFTYSGSGATKDMFAGTSGEFSGDPALDTQYYFGTPVLSFENDSSTGVSSSTIKYVNNGTNAPDVKYSYDNNTWNSWSANSSIALDSTHPKIYVKGNNANGFSNSFSSYSNFVMSGKIKASGKVTSLIDNGACNTVAIPCDNCFVNLFADCASLTTAPNLTATKLATGCYQSMFKGCTSLATAPTLPAQILADSCYQSMFQGCLSLEVNDAAGTPFMNFSANASDATKDMLVGTGGVKTDDPVVNTQYYYSSPVLMFENDFDANVTSSTIKYVNNGDNNPDVEFSYDKVTWNDWNHGTSITLDATHPKLYVKGDNAGGFSTSSSNYTNFIMTGKIKASGNVLSLLDNGACNTTTIPCSYCFNKLFENCASLTTTPNLPATTLKANCYSSMFQGCSALTSVPSLPATTLVDSCYQSMYKDCSSLKISTSTGNPFMKFSTGATDATKDMISGTSGTVTDDPVANTQYYFDLQGLDACLAFENDFISTDSSKIRYVNNGNNMPNVSYSYDKVNWNNWNANYEITLDYSHPKIFVKGENTEGFSTSTLDYSNFEMSGRIKASGNVMSLVDNGACNTTTIPCANCFYYLFVGCASLVTSPTLPATTLTDSCYEGIFIDCTNMTTAPDLPATQLNEKCYTNMFAGCTSLEAAPIINAETLAKECCSWMFNDCINLKSVGELKATNLEDGCYKYMFFGCSNLKSIPNMNVSQLATECCAYMFSNCTSITTSPTLGLTTLAEGCYANMFSGCTELTSAPSLPAETLAKSCYEGMFRACKKLKTAPSLNSQNLAEYCYAEMFAETGITDAPTLPALTLSPHCYEAMYMSCDSLKYTSEMKATTLAEYSCCRMYYSCNGLQITNLLNAQNLAPYCYKEMFKKSNIGEMPLLEATELKEGCYQGMFEDSGVYWLSGDVLPATTLADNCYERMFKGCSAYTTAPTMPATKLAKESYKDMFRQSGLTTAPQLNSTELAEGCYMSMFYKTKLTVAPSLPAGTLAPDCYNEMFALCASLEEAPQLSATSLAPRCYAGMFAECAKMTTSPDLPATELSESCYENMFNGCTLLDAAPVLSSTSLAPRCYAGMFSDCSALTDMPELLATELKDGCYDGMFHGCSALINVQPLNAPEMKDNCYKNMFSMCTNLQTPPVLQATKLAPYCYSSMFLGCSKLSAAPELPVMTLEEQCYSGMFAECETLTSAPELPATTLADSCYFMMFENCTLLAEAPVLPATTMADKCYSEMFENCTSLTSAPALPATTLADECYSFMFAFCTGLTSAPQLSAENLVTGCYQYMFHGCSLLKISSADGTKIFKCTDQDCCFNMFSLTAGPFVGTPETDKTYYYQT